MRDIFTMPKSKGEMVAQSLLERIIASGLSPGASFATEAELLTQFNVSRPTLREGLRLLESQGVLELRPGPGGGIILRKPSTGMLAHVVSVFLRLHDVPFIDLLKAREAIEPALALEAAANGTEEDFDELEASIIRMAAIKGDEDGFLEENRIFHSIIARAAGNQVLEIFWSTISILASGEQYGLRYSFGNQDHVLKAHRGILEACRKRDGKVAAERMAEHVSELEHLVRKKYQHLLHEPTRVVARPGRRLG
jgi:DNA-binding FadR family transcriptional regulator